DYKTNTVAFQAQKTKGKKPGAKFGHTRQPTSSKKHPLSQIEAAKSGSSSKRATGSKTGHLEKETQSSSAMDTNLSQPLASTPVVAEMHKEDQQAAGGPTSLGFTSKEGANPQLSSGMLAFIHNKPIYSVSTIIHSESASRCDANVSLCVDSLSYENPKEICYGELVALNIIDTDGKEWGVYFRCWPHYDKGKYVMTGLKDFYVSKNLQAGDTGDSYVIFQRTLAFLSMKACHGIKKTFCHVPNSLDLQASTWCRKIAISI
ncbi:integrase, catalytic region, zinc finger, CCHC-type containing protein, partial [Tanacetum coccineum]